MKIKTIQNNTKRLILLVGLLFLIIPVKLFSQTRESVDDGFRDKLVNRINTRSELKRLYSIDEMPVYTLMKK